MKNIKRISALFLAVIMTVMTIGSTTAFAAERTDVFRKIRTDTVSISTTNSKVGYNFVCPSNELKFEVSYSGSNIIVAVRLHDQTTNQPVKEWQSSSGFINENIAVTAGHTYIFEYLLAYGSGTVSVTNNIYAYYRNN